MCFCVLLYFTACMLYYCNTVGWAGCDGGLIWWLTILLQCFDTVGWVTWPVKISSPNDLYCVEWDVKPYSTTIPSAAEDANCLGPLHLVTAVVFRVHFTLTYLLTLRQPSSTYITGTYNSILSQQHLCKKISKLVDVRWSYSVQHQCRFFRHSVHCESKKWATLTMAITLSVLDRFAKFFRCCKQQ